MLSSSGALEAKTTPGPRSRRVERGSTRNPFIYAAIVVFGLALFWLSEPSRAGGQILEQYGGWQVIAYMLLYTLPTIVAVTAAGLLAFESFHGAASPVLKVGTMAIALECLFSLADAITRVDNAMFVAGHHIYFLTDYRPSGGSESDSSSR
ncbi:hypothetical protein [Rhodococcus sp. USK13]|uniref:hypothetical protein n=1 Tax=Rhodococcus sp. USK13 TaxID=2806442 RepID=UPI001BD1B3FD|nr:hypothetical protein [Rhodococcus sp. USK13]